MSERSNKWYLDRAILFLSLLIPISQVLLVVIPPPEGMMIVICFECKGYGRTGVYDMDDPGVSHYVPCRRCEGTGRLWEKPRELITLKEWGAKIEGAVNGG